MAEEVGQAYVSIVPSLKGFSARLKAELASELRRIDGPINDAGHRAGQGFGDRLREGIRGRLAGIGQMLKTGLLVGAAAAVAGLGAITSFGLRSAAQLEQTQIGFESLLGSAEKAKSFIEELQQFAAKTPFEFQGVADASRRILAFGSSVGITKDQVIPTLTTIGDLVSVLGGSQENIDGIIRAFGQIASKGRLMGGEVLQLAEQLPGFNVNQAIAAKLGVSVAEALQLQEAGAIDAKTAIDGILEGMAAFPGAAGAMIKQSQTLTGVFSTFKDTIAIALTNAFQPVIPAIKDSLSELTPVLGEALNQLAPSLGGILSSLLPLLGSLIEGIVPILSPILDALADTFDQLGPVIKPVGEAFGKVVAALAPLLPQLIKELLPVTMSLIPVVEALVPVIEAIAPPLLDVLVALLPIIPPLADLLAITLALAVPIIKLVGLLVSLAAKFLIAGAVQILTDMIEILTVTVGALVSLITDTDWGALWGQIVDAAIAIWQGIADFFTKTVPDKFSEWFRDLGPQLVEAGKSIVTGIWSGISSLGGWLWDKVKNFVKDNIVNPVASFLGISSPSTLFAGLGEDTVAGYAQGIEASARQASMATAGMASAAASGASVAPAAAPQTAELTSSDPWWRIVLDEQREQIRRRYGGDVVVALGTG